MPADNWSIVDRHGRPLRREQLTERVSGPTVTGVRSILTGHPAQGLTPARLTGILRQAEQGDATSYLELAEEMEEKDLHYLAVLKKRKEAIAQLPIKVVPADESAEAKADAELIERFIERDELQDEIIDIQDAIGKGWSVTEIIWEFTDKEWMPIELERSDQRFFEFDRDDGKTLRLKGEHGDLQDLAAFKYIIHKTPAKSGIPVRGGLARAAGWHYLFKNMAWKDWVSFLEKFGMPLRLGRYDNGETEENKRILLNALAQLGSDAAAMYPKTMEVEFIDAKAGTVPDGLYKVLIDTCDEYLSKVVLGQTNTTDSKSGGLGSGQANVHREVEETIERSDARRLAATLKRDLIVPIVMLNHGRRRKYPSLKIGHDDPVDVAALTSSAAILIPMGARVSRKKMTEAAGLPEAEDDDDLLIAPGKSTGPDADREAGEEAPADPPSNPAKAPPKKTPQKRSAAKDAPETAETASSDLLEPLNGLVEAVRAALATRDAPDDDRDPDFIDLTAEEALSDWEELGDPIVALLADAIGSAATIGEARTNLAQAIEKMDVTAFAELIARGGIAARLQGELDVQIEQDEG